MQIAIFYGTSTCYTEIVAEKIQQLLISQYQYDVALFNVANSDINLMQNYQYLIMGIPTWDYGELQEDWENNWQQLDNINFNGKTVAIFGLGDQIGYPKWFLDSLGYLHDKVKNLGAKMCGYWPATGYNFEQSTALTANKSQFVGLALDEENEFELSEKRIINWCQQIATEFSDDEAI